MSREAHSDLAPHTRPDSAGRRTPRTRVAAPAERQHKSPPPSPQSAQPPQLRTPPRPSAHRQPPAIRQHARPLPPPSPRPAPTWSTHTLPSVASPKAPRFAASHCTWASPTTRSLRAIRSLARPSRRSSSSWLSSRRRRRHLRCRGAGSRRHGRPRR